MAPTRIQDHADPAYKQAVIATARQAGVPILPAISDESGRHTMAGILADPAQRAAHIATLVGLVLNNGYDGIDIDYEQFAYADGRDTWPSTVHSWTAFVQELANAMHAHGKLLAVTVPPTYDMLGGPDSGYWVYNYPVIGQVADRVRIMAYDFSVPTAGPIAPLAWVQSLTNFAVTMIPAQKLQLGIPAYGREWSFGHAGTCGGAALRKHSYTPDEFNGIAAAHGVAPIWDPATGEKIYSYTANDGVCAVNRWVSYVDADGLAARKAIADAAGLGWHRHLDRRWRRGARLGGPEGPAGCRGSSGDARAHRTGRAGGRRASGRRARGGPAGNAQADAEAGFDVLVPCPGGSRLPARPGLPDRLLGALTRLAPRPAAAS